MKNVLFTEHFFFLLIIKFREDIGAPEGKSVISNPVAVHDANNQTIVFCLCDDGQVYYLQQDADRLVDFGKWIAVPFKIPFEAGGPGII